MIESCVDFMCFMGGLKGRGEWVVGGVIRVIMEFGGDWYVGYMVFVFMVWRINE